LQPKRSQNASLGIFPAHPVCFFIKATWRKYFSHIFNLIVLVKQYFWSQKISVIAKGFKWTVSQELCVVLLKLKPWEKEGFFRCHQISLSAVDLFAALCFHQIYNIRVSVADP
jgi:hypothetical protein